MRRELVRAHLMQCAMLMAFFGFCRYLISDPEYVVVNVLIGFATGFVVYLVVAMAANWLPRLWR